MKTIWNEATRRLLAPYRDALGRLCAFGVAVSILEVAFLGCFYVSTELVLQKQVRLPGTDATWQLSLTIAAIAAFVLLAVGFARFALSMRFEKRTARLGSDVMADLREDSMAAHLDMPLEALWRSRGGELQFHINNLPVRCKEYMLQAPSLIASVAMIAIVSIVLAKLSWELFIGGILLGAIYALFLQKVSRHVYYVICERLTTQEKGISSLSHEAIAGVRQIRVFGMQGFWNRHFSGLVRENADEMARHRWWAMLPQKCLDFLVVIVFTATLFGFALARDRLSVADASALVTFVFAGLRLVPYLVQAGRAYGLMTSTVPMVEEYFHHLDVVKQRERDGAALPFAPADPLTLELDGVSFAYPGRAPVLQSVSMTLEPGTVTALVGLSGSGKSTLIDLILGLIQPSSGSVRCNGVDLSKLRRDEWLRAASLATQEPFLFHETLEKNLRAARPDASDGEISEACRLAGVQEFLPTLPHGLQTIVGDRGTSLSGGQRQRVALARALLKPAGLLVLDEPTGSVDAQNEEAIYRSLWPVLKRHTTLIVSHNLASVKKADRIYVLVEGRIRQEGRHEDLISAPGIYRDLFALQSGAPAELAPIATPLETALSQP
ncbi:MAG: ABC transporter ATP-binding protein [Verrucomicrobiae bacterium]|nr:ABC transporter ATP-binding protein [Verrucomicrobiae bacterium]